MSEAIFTLQADNNSLKDLFASDEESEEITKTASAEITSCVIALIGLNYELKYTPEEQIQQTDALSSIDFDEEESDNDRVCIAINNISFPQSKLASQAKIRTLQ